MLFNVGSGENMELRDGQAHDVIDPRVQVGNPALRAEIFEHIRLRHRHVNLTQVKEIVEVRGGTIGDDRHDAQIVAIVENFRELVGEGHVGAGELSAGDPDRPLVLRFLSPRR